MKILPLIIALLLQACANIEDTSCFSANQLTQKELEKLEQITLDNEFFPGCVTERISDLSEVPATKYQHQCKADFDKTLSYVQWLEIYQSCIAK